MLHEKISLFGYASGIAGARAGSEKGPQILKDSPFWTNSKLHLDWQAMLKADSTLSKLATVKQLCEMLSLLTANSAIEKKFFTVFGGDHSSAIGTWSGVSHAKKASGSIGLIWVDAHMDSHTPETSQSGNIHGMPLACLLGYGDSALTHLLNPESKLKPENVCLIGIRSYETGEMELLKKLGVRIFYIDEVKQRGMDAVMKEAITIVKRNTVGYGITIDIDGIDPKDAPGTGTREPNGIPGQALCEALTLVANDADLLGAEIVEFDPSRDQDHLTEKLIIQMLQAICLGK